MIDVLDKKKKQFNDVTKIGRTHLQDATPLTVGQELGGFSAQISSSLNRINLSLDEILYLAQGGTAVGTGLNLRKVYFRLY